MKEKKQKKLTKTNSQNVAGGIPNGLKVLLRIFKEKNPDIKLTVKEIKKA